MLFARGEVRQPDRGVCLAEQVKTVLAVNLQRLVSESIVYDIRQHSNPQGHIVEYFQFLPNISDIDRQRLTSSVDIFFGQIAQSSLSIKKAKINEPLTRL